MHLYCLARVKHNRLAACNQLAPQYQPGFCPSHKFRVVVSSGGSARSCKAFSWASMSSCCVF